MKQVVRALLGLAVVLAWWTLRGDDGGTQSEAASRIPAQVWGGGAGTLSIEAETTTAAQMRVSFSREESAESEYQSLETYEEVAAGQHSWSIDVPAGAGGYVELGAVAPTPGDHMSFTIQVNGSTVFEQSEALERRLESGTAFFLQAYFDDYATGTLGED